MSLTRRSFLKTAGGATLALLAAPRLVFASGSALSMDTLVVVFLRGGLDGLHAVTPYGDSALAALRPTLALPAPGSGDGALLDLDGYFGLHPSLAPLLPSFQAGRATAVHATGFAQGSRSHFTCQDGIERAATVSQGISSGWIGRWLETLDPGSTFQAIGMGRAVQSSLRGAVPAIGMQSIGAFTLSSSSPYAHRFEGLFEALSTREDPVNAAARQALGALDELASAAPGAIPVQNDASYPSTPFGTQLKEVAQLIRADLGLRVACIDIGGFDTHAREQQDLAPLLAELGSALAAFEQDIGAAMGNVHVLTLTDFGRRAYENASGGTDHGTGQAMLLLSGALTAPPVHADWPGLHAAALLDGDLAVTTDYRAVLSELLSARFAAPDLAHVFPGFTMSGTAGLYSHA